MYKTGVDACDELAELNLQGNIIPHQWYETIVKTELQYPKPYLLAIVILAEIVYWYRPTVVLDERTGTIIGLRKKFGADLLQRSYESLAQKFGFSKDAIKDAVVFLEQLGVIFRVFREVNAHGMCLNNVMFLGLDVKRLRELTYPKENTQKEQKLEAIADSKSRWKPDAQFSRGKKGQSTEPLGKFAQRGEVESLETERKLSPDQGRICLEGMEEFPRTYTETSRPKKSLEILSKDSSINQMQVHSTTEDGLGKALKNVVIDDLAAEDSIPFWYIREKNKMEAIIRYLVGWYEESFKKHSDFERMIFDLLVKSLTNMVTSQSAQSYHGDNEVTGENVLQKLNRCIDDDGDLTQFAAETVDDYIKAAQKKEILNKEKYMMTVAWNSLKTYKVKQACDFERLFNN